MRRNRAVGVGLLVEGGRSLLVLALSKTGDDVLLLDISRESVANRLGIFEVNNFTTGVSGIDTLVRTTIDLISLLLSSRDLGSLDVVGIG